MGESVNDQWNNMEDTKGSISLASCPCCIFTGSFTFLPPEMVPSITDSSKRNSGDFETSDSKEKKCLTPQESLERLRITHNDNRNEVIRENVKEKKRPLHIVDTHGHAHLNRDRAEHYVTPSSSPTPSSAVSQPSILSLTCAVSESDWESLLSYSSQSPSILPALGVHPWYTDSLSPSWLSRLEELLLRHPSALVGEIGLCKAARNLRGHPQGKSFALELQREVFESQFRLAGRLKRGVSVHCVRQQGVLLSVLRGLKEEGCAFPPVIGMHSFTGTKHHVKEILTFEEELKRNNEGEGKNAAPMFYFGFSHMVNVVMCSGDKSVRQGREAVRAVPRNRILVESDVHTEQDVILGTAGAIAYVASALGEEVEDVADFTAANGLSFMRKSLT